MAIANFIGKRPAAQTFAKEVPKQIQKVKQLKGSAKKDNGSDKMQTTLFNFFKK